MGLGNSANKTIAQLILLTAFGAMGHAVGVEAQFMPVFAHPTGLACGVADHQGVIGYVFSYYRSGTDKGELADIVTAYDGGIGTDAGPLTYMCLRILVAAVYRAARIGNIGKNAARPEEYIVVAGYAGIDADIVLHFNIVAEYNTGAYNHILAEIAVAADAAIGHDMGEMPDFGACAYFATFIDNSGWMGIVFGLGFRLHGWQN